jgi:preprotein translocase subunit SecG
MATFLGLLLSFTALLLIIIVLIQRGRGGGLAGALGGGGGQSAFGTKAGDLFTKITVGLAFFWIVLCIITLRVLSSSSSRFTGGSVSESTAPATPGTAEAVPTGTEKTPGAAKSNSTGTATGATTSGGAAKSETTPAPASSKSAVPPTAPAGK